MDKLLNGYHDGYRMRAQLEKGDMRELDMREWEYQTKSVGSILGGLHKIFISK